MREQIQNHVFKSKEEHVRFLQNKKSFRCVVDDLLKRLKVFFFVGVQRCDHNTLLRALNVGLWWVLWWWGLLPFSKLWRRVLLGYWIWVRQREINKTVFIYDTDECFLSCNNHRAWQQSPGRCIFGCWNSGADLGNFLASYQIVEAAVAFYVDDDSDSKVTCESGCNWDTSILAILAFENGLVFVPIDFAEVHFSVNRAGNKDFVVIESQR